MEATFGTNTQFNFIKRETKNGSFISEFNVIHNSNIVIWIMNGPKIKISFTLKSTKKNLS